MSDEETRRSRLVAAAAETQAAWQRLYERMLKLEFDGYTGVDPDLLPRIMGAVLERYRAQLHEGEQTFEIIRQVYDEAIAEIDRTHPRRT
jgi:hypothetical protein